MVPGRGHKEAGALETLIPREISQLEILKISCLGRSPGNEFLQTGEKEEI